jgi:hypothetical protein
LPQAITVTDAQGRYAVYAPLRIGGKIVVPELARIMHYAMRFRTCFAQARATAATN